MYLIVFVINANLKFVWVQVNYSYINVTQLYIITDDDSRSFLGECRLRSDCIHAV